MALRRRPAVLAGNFEAARQPCPVNKVVSMPAAFIVDFTNREIVSRVYNSMRFLETYKQGCVFIVKVFCPIEILFKVSYNT